jgi:hypothetical protein
VCVQDMLVPAGKDYTGRISGMCDPVVLQRCPRLGCGNAILQRLRALWRPEPPFHLLCEEVGIF